MICIKADHYSFMIIGIMRPHQQIALAWSKGEYTDIIMVDYLITFIHKGFIAWIVKRKFQYGSAGVYIDGKLIFGNCRPS